MRLLFFLLLLLVACGSPSSESAPCPADRTPSPPPSLAAEGSLDAAAPVSAPTWSYAIVLTPAVGADVESAIVRAARAWELRTMGAVRVEVLARTAATPRCTDGLISVDEIAGGSGDAEEAIGSHEVRTCHDIVIRYPWADDVLYRALYARLGVSPLVLVASHEIGHALGLGHASPEERSVMVPTVKLSPVAKPTCGDASALAFLKGAPVRCYEEKDTPADAGASP